MIEILVSLGIIVIGLLGVAALLPVGRYDIMVAAKADRGAACARAAMRDLVVRGMLSQTVDATTGISVPPVVALAIDPRGCAANPLPPQLFPANSIHGTTLPPAISMSRVTIASAWSNPLSTALADRICRWRDDLQFDMTGERTDRPRQFFRLQDGTQSSDVALTVTPTCATADPEGAYSWMATVCPATDPGKCTVSVVVFYNRSLPPDRELACAIEGFAFGSGDVVLYVPTAGLPSNYSSTAVREKLMALRQGDWILLRGMRTSGTVITYAFKWCRVGRWVISTRRAQQLRSPALPATAIAWRRWPARTGTRASRPRSACSMAS